MSEHAPRPSTIMRQWQMLRLIPQAPRTITVAALHDKLKAIDFAIGIRTIQRDLLDLAEIFPLTNPADSKPFGWCWMENAARMDMPGLSTPAALTLALMEQHLRHALPPSTLDSMQPYFSAARQTLNASVPARPPGWARYASSPPCSGCWRPTSTRLASAPCMKR